jgi:hypothetical protein
MHGGRCLPGLTREESAAEAIAALYLLERHDHIEADEHNGLILAIDAFDVVHVVPNLKQALALMEQLKGSGGRVH